MLINNDKKNTLIYCNDKNEHWLTKTWNTLFSDDFIKSNKVFVDINIGHHGDKTNVYKGNSFVEEVLTYNNNL